MENLGIFYDYLVHFTAIYLEVIGYIFTRFGILCQEKSGNPVQHWRWSCNLKVLGLGPGTDFMILKNIFAE
jgi:hypothetical protein